MSKVTRRRALVGMILPALAVTALPASAAAEPDAMAQADLYGQGYVNGLAQQRGPTGDELSVSYHEGWDAGRAAVEQINVPAAVVAGALYDFMGYLTTREEPITVSGNHTVYALMDAYKAWAKERGLWEHGYADVIGWQERLV